MAISELEAIIELAPQIAHCALVGSRSLLRPPSFQADNMPSLAGDEEGMGCSQIHDTSSCQMDDSVLCLPFCTAAYRARTTDDIHQTDGRRRRRLYYICLALPPAPACAPSALQRKRAHFTSPLIFSGLCPAAKASNEARLQAVVGNGRTFSWLRR